MMSVSSKEDSFMLRAVDSLLAEAEGVRQPG